MNERFWELVEQADEEGGDDPDIRDEVFGKLLIQECLSFVRPNSYFQAYPENMIGGEDGVRLLQTITNQIEEHFGVEL